MQKIKDFFVNNLIIFIYILFAFAFEIISITFAGCSPYLTKPLYTFSLFAFFVAILFLARNRYIQIFLAIALLIGQLVMNVGFVYLYDSNGTFFEWAMMNQRDDAKGIIEDLHLNGKLIAILVVLAVVYIAICVLLMIFLYKGKARRQSYKLTAIISGVVGFITFASTTLIPVINGFTSAKLSYVDRYLYGDATNKYQQMGITSNAVYELFNGTIAESAIKIDDKGIEDFVYDQDNLLLETSEYFGISEGNNLLYILAESFEWYTFMGEYCTEEQSKILYPNLNKLISESVYADNFYAREKTDTAEILALIGSNPTREYVNYGYENNAYPWSLPNMFRKSVEENGNTVKQLKSFHQHVGTFYNRNNLHKNIGFEDLVDVVDMKEYGVLNYWVEGEFKGERTLDSDTISKMKNEIIPETQDGEQFMSFWLSYSTHGNYQKRKSLEAQGYYDMLDDLGVFPEGKGTKSDYLRTYAATVIDFDRAIGMLFDRLEETGQLEKTTVVIFADHNTYYNNLSYHAKHISERHNSELYRVPFIIYDQKLKQAMEDNGESNVISKFTTTADIIPTVFDIFGIKGYENLYFGSSMLVDDIESIIYSRAYGIFITDKLICYGANNLIYKSKDYTKADYNSFIKRAEEHLYKLEYIDKIYYNDYFKNHELKWVS